MLLSHNKLKKMLCFFSQQELNPNVEAKLSYLLKFVQKTVEDCDQKEEPTFTISEVGND